MGSIAVSGFEPWASKHAMYGQGTYFASQACKSHQYTCPANCLRACSCPGRRTIIISRVALGDPFFAKRVDKKMTHPPRCGQAARFYGSVVANPGEMQGHQRGRQDHQEFVSSLSTRCIRPSLSRTAFEGRPR